MLVTIK